jgi:signal transduction histidine kinase/CheY-like chemotaxis protein
MLSGGLAVLVFSVLFAWQGFVVPALLEASYVVIIAASWVWVRLTNRGVRAITWLHIFAVFIITSLVAIVMGGHYASGGFLVWALIGPSAALVFFSLGSAFAMSLLHAGLVVLVAVIGDSLRMTPTMPQGVADWFTAINVIGATGLVLVTLTYFLKLLREEQRERELSLAEAMKVQKLESVGTLAGGIAHDFNNLMMTVQGNLRLAREAGALESETTDGLLERAERAVGRATHLTAQLLTFARGGAPVRMTASIGDTIRESADFALAGQPVTCTHEIPEDLRSVDADLTQISQVIQNLAMNAAQAMPQGGRVWVSCKNLPADEIPVGLSSERGYVSIEVRDDGPGIATAAQARIFDPYFTTRGEGTGLGLAICYRIVNDHEGRISVTSALGRGTSFQILLPVAEGSNKALPAPSPVPRPGKGRVLVMDDDPDLCYLLTRLTGSLGYEAIATADGAEALTRFREALVSGQAFDAVILDLTVKGGMGGVEAVREILAIDPTAQVVASSGYADSPVLAAYRDHGFVGVLRKPYGRVEIGEALQLCVGAGPLESTT